MLLDIGIPCFNDSKYLKKCLDSIDEQFVDNYKDIEVWIISDDSPYYEDYKNLIGQYINFNINLIQMDKNSGPGPCRNKVIYKGKADWITWIDDDDIFISNPLKHIDIFNKNPDIIRSNVYEDGNKIHVGSDDVLNCAFGSIFNRKFLQDNQFEFPPMLGVVGTEDSIFLLLTNASASSIVPIPSFVFYTRRANSQYTLNSISCVENYAISLLPMCNLYYITKYKKSIKNYQMLWENIEKQFFILIKLYKEYLSEDNTDILNEYLLYLHMLLFKTIRGFFPESKDIKPYIKDTKLLPHIYYAYHFCYEGEDGETIYCQFNKNKFINTDNFLKTLSTPNAFTYLHFPSLYYGLIKYPCSDMVKRGRKEKGYPEKYWNF